MRKRRFGEAASIPTWRGDVHDALAPDRGDAEGMLTLVDLGRHHLELSQEALADMDEFARRISRAAHGNSTSTRKSWHGDDTSGTSAAAGSEIEAGLEIGPPRRIAVGRGTAFVLGGYCYHRAGRTRELAVGIGGTRQRVERMRLPRDDVYGAARSGRPGGTQCLPQRIRVAGRPRTGGERGASRSRAHPDARRTGPRPASQPGRSRSSRS